MIRKQDILDRAGEWSLRPEIVEKDYVLGWLLAGFATHPVASATWIFKGGTCVKKCFFETYRFSEDLDFTLLPDAPYSAPASKGSLPRSRPPSRSAAASTYPSTAWRSLRARTSSVGPRSKARSRTEVRSPCPIGRASCSTSRGTSRSSHPWPDGQSSTRTLTRSRTKRRCPATRSTSSSPRRPGPSTKGRDRATYTTSPTSGSDAAR